MVRLNPDLKSMAKDEDFSQAPPFLFGPGFEKKAKERTEALEYLQNAAAKPNTQASSSSYNGSVPQKRFLSWHQLPQQVTRREWQWEQLPPTHYHNRGPPGPTQIAAAKKA